MSPELMMLATQALSGMGGDSGGGPGMMRNTGTRGYTKQNQLEFLKQQAAKDIGAIGNQAGAPGETMNDWRNKQIPIYQRPLAPNETIGEMYA